MKIKTGSTMKIVLAVENRNETENVEEKCIMKKDTPYLKKKKEFKFGLFLLLTMYIPQESVFSSLFFLKRILQNVSKTMIGLNIDTFLLYFQSKNQKPNMVTCCKFIPSSETLTVLIDHHIFE